MIVASPKLLRQFTLVEKVTAVTLFFGAVGSLLSQQLVYALAPLPFTFGINQLSNRRRYLETLLQNSQTVVIERIQAEITPLFGQNQHQQRILTELIQEISHLKQQQQSQTTQFAQLQNLLREEFITLQQSQSSGATLVSQLQNQLTLALQTQEQHQSQSALVKELQTELEAQKLQAQEWENLLVEDNQKLSQKLEQLDAENQNIVIERDNFQLLYEQTQEQLKQLFQSWHQTLENVQEQEEKTETALNLSGVKLGIVGGHPETRRQMLSFFQYEYGLENYVEIGSSSEQRNSYQTIRNQLKNCDLILVMTRYIDHSSCASVNKLKCSPDFHGEVLMVNSTGVSGILQELTPQLIKFQNS